MSLLNAVDGEIENILARSSSLLLPVPSSVPTNNGDVKSLEDTWDANTLQDLSALKQLITFTSHLLRNAMNKDVYNSTEHLVSLLRCLDDELAFLSLSALASLSMSPMTHKCVDENRHSTTLHKQGNLCHPLFDIAEAAYKATKQVDISLLPLHFITVSPCYVVSLCASCCFADGFFSFFPRFVITIVIFFSSFSLLPELLISHLSYSPFPDHRYLQKVSFRLPWLCLQNS